MTKEEYLGYVLKRIDGWHFCLRAPRENGDHVVYLEPFMVKQFIDFTQRALAPQERGAVELEPLP